MSLPPRPGKVYLIGAGPGDPRLLTLRAVEALQQSDVVLTDALVHPAALRHARDDAWVVDVGKRAGGPCTSQADIHELMVEQARAGHTVARLKGGDPFVFGRGGEEAEALVEAGLEWEVIPGVTAALGAAAYAGIPLLHRAHASSVTFVTGHQGREALVAQQSGDTLVVYMCGRTLVGIAHELLRAGRPASTPLALVHAGTCDEQQVAVGTLGELAQLSGVPLEAPVLAIVGEVVRLAEKLHWFGPRPLTLAGYLRDAAA